MGGVGLAVPGTVIQSTVDAHWAESVVLAHNQRRVPQGPATYRSPYDAAAPDAAPPALDPGESRRTWGYSADPHARAARFRDGLPPPPPPPRPITEREVAQILQQAGLDPADPKSPDRYAEGVRLGHLPPLDEARAMLGLAQTRRAASLRPQDEFDAKLGVFNPNEQLAQARKRHASGGQTRPPTLSPPPDHQNGRLTRPGLSLPLSVEPPAYGGSPVMLPADLLPAMAQSLPLTPSQKRRLRRRRQREHQEALVEQVVPTQPAPAPTQAVAPTNGVYHPPEAPLPSRECGHQARLYLPHLGQWLEVACEISLRPHPGQPHLLQVPPAYLDGATEVFIGWFGPGE